MGGTKLLKILLVEDDAALAAELTKVLRAENFVLDRAATGEDAQHLGETEGYDAVVLDLGLPKGDGVSVLRAWRAAGRTLPVLVLTARDGWSDKVAAFKAGADDYLVKPFELEEMSARIRAAVRRGANQVSNDLVHGEIALNLDTKAASLRGVPVALTAREYNVLYALLLRKNSIVTRAQIEETLYGWGDEVDSNAIEVYVHNLRKKFGSDSIVTVRGLGYRMKTDGE